MSPLDPVSHPCTAGIAVEHFGCARLCCVYIYVDGTTCYYSLLKIFCVIHYSGLNQHRKYLHNENFPNYGSTFNKLI